MKRSISPDFSSASPSASEAKRFDPFVAPPNFQQYNQKHQTQQQKQQQKHQQQHQQQQQQQKHQQQHQQQHIQIHQQQQILAQQQIQAAAAVQQQQQQQHQQQQFQLQHQIQQQSQYGTNPSFFNQQAYFPMSSVNMSPFSATAPPMMFNGSPTWNFMSTPPPFFTSASSPANGSSQPPLPPPELKPEKPPLPRDPEPPLGHPKKKDFLIRPGIGSPSYNSPGLRAPGSAAGLRIRGLNALNGAMYNGFSPGAMRGPPPIRQQSPNSGMNSAYGRNRRRNPHHFPLMNQQGLLPRMDFSHFGDYNEFNEEEYPAGPEKLTIIMSEADKGQIQVNKKAKRKPMSSRYSSRSKEWVREDAEAALALEREYSKAARRQMLILKFPDPDLNKYIVKKYSPFIETVHFQQPSTPRYCFVQLKEGADTAKVLEAIREIPFGTGKIAAEPKIQPVEDHKVSPEEIDPYTLYIGNLPTSISVKAVKLHFPNAQRIDIGYAQRMRYTRYAFIRYSSVEESMKAYKNTVNALLESRSLIVRFRRQKGNIGLPGETKAIAPQRDGREAPPASKPKPWDDAEGEDDDYHEDEDAFMLDEIEEDDDDIILQEDEGLNSLRTNGLGFAMVHPKDEIDGDKEQETAASSQKIKSTNEETTQKQKEATKTPEAITQPSTAQSSQNNNLNEAATPQPTTTSVQATTSNASVPEEPIDTKANVLDKAKELLQTTAAGTRPKSESPDCICVDPPETARKVRLEGVKVENNVDESSSDSDGINLLGTRVKDEVTDVPEPVPPPTMDDIYLDDYEYDDMDGDPEEEDDDWADTSLSTRATDWEEIRRRELSAKEDKPDLKQLGQISDTLSTPAAKVLPIVADLEPKSEFEKLYNAHQVHNIGGTDDLNDIFSEMNSDLEDDDDDQF